MRFLVDNALSHRIAASLREEGHDAVHVRDLGMANATDELIMARAAAEGRVVVSADTDFSTILSLSGAVSPSVILFRRAGQSRPAAQAELLISNLESVKSDLARGSVVVIDQNRIRIRLLPIL